MFFLQKNYTFDDQSEFTDYGAGFMTVREKHWLAGIQTIQFHNSNPLEEDYYFTVSKIIHRIFQFQMSKYF